MTAYAIAEFGAPIDIWNRALDHLGQPHILSANPLDDSKAALLMSSGYDKLRRAEMQRNVWRFGIREAPLRAINNISGIPFAASPTPSGAPTMELVPGAFDNTKLYLTGSIVAYGGQVWQAVSNVAAGGGNPDSNPTGWDLYFGTLVAAPFDTSGTSTYYAGDVVYTLNGVTPTVYLSMIEGNVDTNSSAPLSSADVPGVVDAWSAATYYSKYDTVTGADAVVYQSLIDLNINVNPTGGGNPGQWTPLSGVVNQATQMSNPTWLQLTNCGLTQIRLVYPMGAGPVTQSTTRNIYQLPNGFLKRAPQDPKAGSQSYLGAPSGLNYDDFDLQDNYLISRQANVIRLRFAADITRVTSMTSMFCEGLGCRLAAEFCEALTQSTEKLQAIGMAYKGFMGEARMANGIETGAYEPPVDDWLSCRM